MKRLSLVTLLFSLITMTIVTMAYGEYCFALYPDPNDYLPDDDALQCLIDQGGTIRLNPPTTGPGYIIARGLRITVPGTTITSSTPPQKAVLFSANTLVHACLLDAAGVDNVTLTYLRLDGNRDARPYVQECTQTRSKTGQVEIRGNGAYVANNEFVRAMCGAALLVDGWNWTVEQNFFQDNGYGREVTGRHPPESVQWWSDGIRSNECHSAYIRNNTFEDTTDVAVSVGATSDCIISGNLVRQIYRWAAAGMGFPNGTHYGSSISNNTIQGYTKMSIGLAIGARPWCNSSPSVGGSVVGNTVISALINLNVEDSSNYVAQNTLLYPMSGAECTPLWRGTNCNIYNSSNVFQTGCITLSQLNCCIP